MRMVSFTGLNIRNTRFESCDMQEADFTEADMTGAVFSGCDLLRSTFMHTNLEKADFRSAFNYSFSPETNRIRKARFSMPDVTGLLDGYGIIIE